MKRRPPQERVLLTDPRQEENCFEIELIEEATGPASIRLLRPDFALVALLLEHARKDPAIAEKLSSRKPADFCFDAGELAIVEASPGPERDAIWSRISDLVEDADEPTLVQVSSGSTRTPPIPRYELREAYESLVRSEQQWRQLREDERKWEAFEQSWRSITPTLDLNAERLEPWVEQELAGLESMARAIDLLDATQPPTAESVGSASAKRRVFLLELQSSGLLEAAAAPTKRAHLRRLGLTTLDAYHQAALALQRYLRCPERSEHVEDADPDEPIMVTPISLDWFREGAGGGASGARLRTDLPAFQLLASIESRWNRYEERSGGFGEYYATVYSTGASWATLRWRKDDGVHAKLLSITAP